jgi:release factor glutamine methyltransferase
MTQETTEDSWTVLRLLNWTADFLKRKGSESPRLDAEVLLAHVLKWERVQLYTRHADEVGDRDRTTYRELIKRRAEGSPVAYLVGKKEFFSLSLAVNSDVLIPRPDTETLVVTFLELFKGYDSPVAVDVGAGSGCIPLACVSRHRTARFHAVDLSEAALNVARKNAEALKLSDRVSFHQGDLLASVSSLGPFDAIVSNPPYIATATIPTLDIGVRQYEPHLALDGGEDGLRVVSRLIEQAVPLLKLGGHLILEIGSDQELPVRDLIGSQPSLELAPTIRDAANHPRVVRATRR